MFLLAILIAAGSLQAQDGRSGGSAAPSRPQFEVASIRQNRSLSPPLAGFRPNGFEAVNATARQLITLAYASDPQNVVDEIFAAVQEQLGLKLESGRAPLDVLVIDAIERPSPN